MVQSHREAHECYGDRHEHASDGKSNSGEGGEDS